ncbi:MULTISPECIES: response regulator [unclassified Salinicola]|uniref:response regulator n=1 Tax=unclassified Salinicola TaxID=2634022 RepID=UPI001A8FBB29|nr:MULTISPECIES: response regulator [unclassified Salinicola]MCE3027424.1 response regulator [Salinicola sp. DM10]WIX34081.1 response regulator [Salinicola sp. JS01]
MIKVLLADDHHLVRTSIARVLDEEPDIEIIAEVDSGEAALSACRNQRPDLALMDIRMPGMGGLEAILKLLREQPQISIVVLTGQVEETTAQRLIDAGVAGFISKGTPLDQMIEAVKLVAAGERFISPDIAQRVVLARREGEGNPFDQLSDRELQIALMIINCRRVSLISQQLGLSSKTVNTYRYRIFDKLKVQSDVELTHLGLKHGLVDGFDTH